MLNIRYSCRDLKFVSDGISSCTYSLWNWNGCSKGDHLMDYFYPWYLVFHPRSKIGGSVHWIFLYFFAVNWQVFTTGWAVKNRDDLRFSKLTWSHHVLSHENGTVEEVRNKWNSAFCQKKIDFLAVIYSCALFRFS